MENGDAPRKKGLRGRPRVDYIPNALKIIQESDHYISMFELSARLELTPNQMQCLRRSLKGWENEGLIQIVGIADDGSFAWTKVPRRKDDLTGIAEGAAHAAEVFLDRHGVGERDLDIPKTATAICEALTGGSEKQEQAT